MKKVLVIAALAIVSFANAQKGTVLVAGSVGFGSTSQGDVKSSNFDFSPKVGYQFSDNLTAGVELGIGTSSVTSNTNVETKNNELKVGAFLR